MKAPIGRQGGKSRLALKLISMFPKKYKRFVEPFVGAGNIFYRTEPVEEEIINDLDRDMYIIHKGLQTSGKRINDKFRRSLTKEQFERLKTKTDPVSLLEKYKYSFLSTGKTFDQKKKSKTNFSVYQPRLKNVKIFNKDFKTIIKQYDSPDTFFYLDPPYEGSDETVSNYDSIDPKDIYDSLKGIKGKFMLSYNNSPNIRNLFKKYNIYKVKTKYTGSDPTRGTKGLVDVSELVITNYVN